MCVDVFVLEGFEVRKRLSGAAVWFLQNDLGDYPLVRPRVNTLGDTENPVVVSRLHDVEVWLVLGSVI